LERVAFQKTIDCSRGISGEVKLSVTEIQPEKIAEAIIIARAKVETLRKKATSGMSAFSHVKGNNASVICHSLIHRSIKKSVLHEI